MFVRPKQPGPPHAHRGAAVIEMAVCLPVILLLFLGSIECSNMIHLKQTLTASSYEGARRAIQFDSTNSSVIARCNEVLAARNIVNPQIDLDPADVSLVNPGSPIDVTVSVLCDENSVLPLNLFSGQAMAVTVEMVKE